MNEDKALTIQFLKLHAPELYSSLNTSGRLEQLSEEELTHLYASSQTKTIPGFSPISEIPEDQLPEPNLKMIDNLMIEAKEFDKCNRQRTLSMFMVLKRTAVAAGILMCIGLMFHFQTVREQPRLVFTDHTSQETTDYAIRLRGTVDTEAVFQDELVTMVEDIITSNLSKTSGNVNCRIEPYESGGSVVYLVISTEKGQRTTKIELTTKTEVKQQLLAEIPKMLQ